VKTQEFELSVGDGVCVDTADGPVTLVVSEVVEELNEVWFQVEGPRDLKIHLDNRSRELWGTPTCHGLPRAWLVFSLILSQSVRRDLFMPVFNEFVEDYLFAQQRIQRKWERRWVAFAFTMRTLSMIVSCARLHLLSKLLNAARRFWDDLKRA
jgi:hypothetical protein